MNRREFVGYAALAPLVASAADLRGARADKPSILLPDSARVYEIGHGEARILVGAEQSGGAWWLGSFRNDPGRLSSLHVHHSADEQFYRIAENWPGRVSTGGADRRLKKKAPAPASGNCRLTAVRERPHSSVSESNIRE
jgi:hypothetical protein